MPKPDVTADCPRCGGDGTLPAARYTETPVVCPSCDGAGVVPKVDAPKILEELESTAVEEEASE